MDDVSDFKRSEIVSVILTAVAAGSIAALQPILLGGLMAAGRISSPQIGQAATVETLGMALSAMLAATFLKPTKLRGTIAVAAISSLCANLLTLMFDGLGIIIVRGLNGLCLGIMLWLVVGLLARVPQPGRILAKYLTAQAFIAFLFAGLFTTILLPRFGPAGSYAALAAINCVVLGMSWLLPRSYSSIPDAPQGGWPPARGLLALLGVTLSFAGIFSFWVYVEPLMVELNYSLQLARTAITFAVGAQIVAGIAASTLAGRLLPIPMLIVGSAASILCIVILVMVHATLPAFLALMTFSFFWMFVPAFQLPFLIAIDPSRRTALHIASAQAFGAAIGPLIAAAGVSELGVRSVSGIAIALFLVGAVCIIGAGRAAIGSGPKLVANENPFG